MSYGMGISGDFETVVRGVVTNVEILFCGNDYDGFCLHSLKDGKWVRDEILEASLTKDENDCLTEFAIQEFNRK